MSDDDDTTEEDGPLSLTIVYVCGPRQLRNYRGADYEHGDLIVGYELEPRASSSASNGRVIPVVLESLPQDVQDAYNEALADRQDADTSDAEAADDESEDESEGEQDEEAGTYDDYTVVELKEMCHDREVHGYSTMNKAELIEALEADDAADGGG